MATNSKPRVFVVGDSISMQYGPHLEQALGEDFHYARKTGAEVALKNLDVPMGANGGDSSMVRQYLEHLRKGPAFSVDLMAVNCGLHDVKIHTVTRKIAIELDAYRQNLHAIVELVGELAGELAWVRTTAVDDAMHARREGEFDRYNADVDRYNAVADAVMSERGVAMIDLPAFTATLGPLHETLSDGVHYKPEVCAAHGRFIADWIWRWASRRT